MQGAEGVISIDDVSIPIYIELLRLTAFDGVIYTLTLDLESLQ